MLSSSSELCFLFLFVFDLFKVGVFSFFVGCEGSCEAKVAIGIGFVVVVVAVVVVDVVRSFDYIFRFCFSLNWFGIYLHSKSTWFENKKKVITSCSQEQVYALLFHCSFSLGYSDDLSASLQTRFASCNLQSHSVLFLFIIFYFFLKKKNPREEEEKKRQRKEEKKRRRRKRGKK